MINVGDKYKIDADKYQYILLTAREGKEKVDNQMVDVIKWDKTYFPTIQQCSRAIVETELKDSIIAGVLNNFDSWVNVLAQTIELEEKSPNASGKRKESNEGESIA